MTSTLPTGLQRSVDRWAAAELAGDPVGLDAVLHEQFVFAGPYGYLLDRQEWMARFVPGDRHYTVFSAFTFTADIPARVIGDTALVVGTQRQKGVTRESRSRVATADLSSWFATPTGWSRAST